ncbi:MAG TPA: hypothetical protein DIC64_00455 [Alphaproteobacteria bacterium]|nr:hypothetical protein [Alphaproteobacteria bacterium]
MLKQEFLLPNGSMACSNADIDRYLKESGLALAGDYSDAYFKNVRRKKEELHEKEAFFDFINEYKKRIWNE